MLKPITDFNELLPSAIYEIFTKPKLKPEQNRFRVTELLDSPLKRKLLLEHYENISKNFAYLFFEILGTLAHSFYELKEFEDFKNAILKTDDEETLVSLVKNFRASLKKKILELEFDGITLVGIYDTFEDNVLWDYKITSSFVVKYQKFDYYEKQLQIYRYMLEKLNPGVKVEGLRNLFFIRDFRINSSEIFSTVYVKDYEIWEDEKVESLIKERLEIHRNRNWCSEEDMWLRVKFKIGGKIFSDEKKALEYASKKKLKIEKIYEPYRCLYFCEVSSFCPQWQKMQEFLN